MPRRKIVDLAYIAGLLDGEGSIYISRNTKAGNGCLSTQHILMVEINNTHRGVLEYVQSIFGGTVTAKNRKRSTFLRRRELFGWRTNSAPKSLEVIKAIYPYLKIKKNQATLAIEFMSRRTPVPNVFGHRISRKELRLREDYSLKISRLNHEVKVPIGGINEKAN